MKEMFKPSTDERPIMIICGILALYLLISGFILYLYFLHRIDLLSTIVGVAVFTLIYTPRLLIIKKILTKDIIKIVDNGININNQLVLFSQIQDFKVVENKPAVVFFMNNNMIVYNEAVFYLKIMQNPIEQNSFVAPIKFNIIGSEKTQLMKEFLSRMLNKS